MSHIFNKSCSKIYDLDFNKISNIRIEYYDLLNRFYDLNQFNLMFRSWFEIKDALCNTQKH